MSLAEHLDAVLPGDPEERARFCIDTKEKAAWAIRKIKHLRDMQTENDRIAQEEISRIEEWRKGENDRCQQDIEFFANLLAEYHRGILEDDPKAKTIKLPHGQLQFRAQQPDFKRDDEKLLAWIKANGLPLVKVKEEPEWGELKKALDITSTGAVIHRDTGEIVDGVTAEMRPPKFTVKTD